MKISLERLEYESIKTGFRPEILEKVIHLMNLLNAFAADPFLSSRVALKGGTALNLFYHDCPRLSVDIDINYIASADRELMQQDRLQLISRIEEICLDNEYISQRKPDEHAGGKWIWRYQSSLHGHPRLEIDLNFLTRVPLWPIVQKRSIVLGSYRVDNFPMLDKHELAAGKLKALFSRHSSRDLFDTHYILSDTNFNPEHLRTAFLVYGGMSRVDWRIIKVSDINFEWHEFKNMLLPMLRTQEIEKISDPHSWAKQILSDCQTRLAQLLPLRENEVEFLDRLLDFGEIRPDLISADTTLAHKIRNQPGLIWKVQHVKKYKGIG